MNETLRKPLSKPDLIKGKEHYQLEIKDLKGNIIQHLAACKGGWTLNILESIDYDLISPQGWEVFLGDVYIGTSEQKN